MKKRIFLTLALSSILSVPAFADADDWVSRAFGNHSSSSSPDRGEEEQPVRRSAPARSVPAARKAKRAAAKPKVAAKKKEEKVAAKPAPKPATVAKTAPAVAAKPPVVEPKAEPNDEPAKVGKVEVEAGGLEAKLNRFSHVDPQHKIAREPLRAALAFYATNQHKLSNSRYLGVIDFSQNSAKARFCVINMTTGDTDCFKTAHGVGSDGGGGWAKSFSNRANSHASSVGYYKTLSTYPGKHGTSLRVDGLSATNSNALNRAIVVHGARYVNDGNRSATGRSHGCPAVDDTKVAQIIARLKGGAVIYAWHPKFMSSPSK